MRRTSSRTNGVPRQPARRSAAFGDITITEVMLYTATLLVGTLLAGLTTSATAAGTPSCVNVNATTTVCQNPGNAQIVTSPGTTAHPYWRWPWGGGFSISIGGWGAS